MDSFLSEWADRLGTTVVARPPFPVETFDGTCPACGATDTVHAFCLAPHVWGDATVNDDGVLSFEGGFDWLDDSIDAHIACLDCGAGWAEPDKVEYR